MWKNKKTEEVKEVLRDLKDYDKPPEDGDPKDWVKVIGKDVRSVKGANWGAGKGNW